MTLPTSGPISIGMAINECIDDGSPYGTVTDHAGDYSLSTLAGVTSGSHLQWSYWYGKSLVPTLNGYHLCDMAALVDRYITVCIDLVNWRFCWSQNSTNNGSQLSWINSSTQQNLSTSSASSGWAETGLPTGGANWIALTGSPPPDITLYTSLTCYATFEAGATRTIFSVTQQPDSGNSYIVNVTWNDNAPSGAVSSQYGIYINGTV